MFLLEGKGCWEKKKKKIKLGLDFSFCVRVQPPWGNPTLVLVWTRTWALSGRVLFDSCSFWLL